MKARRIGAGGAAFLLALSITLSLGIGPAIAAAAVAPGATTGAVTSVKPTSASVTGTVNPNGKATTWVFEYALSTSATYGSTTVAANAGAGTADVAVSASLTGLSPATSYHYRLVATNTVGTTDGAAGIFNTTAAPVALTAAATHLTASSATLNAVVNPDALATRWYFEYGTTTKYGSKTAVKDLAAGPNNESVNAGIVGLAPQSTYHFRVIATSSAGTTLGTDFVLITGLTVTLDASTSTAVYGGFVNLNGVVASGLSGAHVTVLSEAFDATSFSGIAAVLSTSGGDWSYTVQPSARTSYEAEVSTGTSSPTVVDMRPAVYLTRIAAGRLSTHVVGNITFASHVLQLQRLSDGLWVTWKHVRLNARSQASFSTLLPKGKTSIRMAIGPFAPGVNQAAPGYLAGFSGAITYVP